MLAQAVMLVVIALNERISLGTNWWRRRNECKRSKYP